MSPAFAVLLFASPPLHFEADVRPILKAACFHCHGEEPKPKGKLDLRTVKVIAKGGHSGPAVVPGKLDDSLLWEKIESDEMPEGPKKLTAAQKATIRKWIEQGAKTARPEPDDPAQARFSYEELSHWAWKPVANPKPPSARDAPIDAFIRAELDKRKLTMSPAADPRTLIRRVTFDLIGLPPTPEEVDAFLKDTSATAYEKLIDRLLANPAYSERWGRHWLDVAGYAETNGDPANDTSRPHAWRFRDYVIRSFNADKPYDQFVREQLAGDELAARPLNIADPRTVELLTAAGFLRMPPDLTQSSDTPADRNQAVADVVKVVGTTFLGLTVGCAQCHDHKYDPIGIDDYYRLRAVFDPAFDRIAWTKPNDRLIDVTPADDIETAACIDADADLRMAEIKEQRLVVARRIFGKQLGKVPVGERIAALEAVDTPTAKRTPAQAALLKKYPTVKPAEEIAFSFAVYDGTEHEKFKKLDAVVAAYRATKPPRQFVMIPAEKPGAKPESRVLHRGDPEQAKQVVTPGDLMVVAHGREVKATPLSASSGRRLAYANYLTDGKHPLVARVFVNRVWAYHFGRGIVSTPGDFGLNGDRPSHPELLDWLATDFAANGWRVKRLHKQILLSAAYRQQSKRTPELDRLDPDNRLLARRSVRRLEAEAVRDAVLAVSGKLNRESFGPSVPVAEDIEGKTVFGRRKLNDGLYAGIETVGDAANRRSVYVESRRALPLSLLDTFDLPAMTPNCDARRVSTVATQSLLFLNDEFAVKQSDDLAERLFKESPDATARVKRAFALLYGAEPTAAEVKACVAFIETQTKYFATHGDEKWKKTVKQSPHAPALQATAALCQALLCTNRFLYVD